MSKSDVQSSYVFPRPTSPSKPNAHPYAIVTSAGAVLSRSHSSTQHVNTRSHYIPASPKSPSQARPGSHSRPSSHRHHYSNSKESPRPLPVPPSPSPSPTKEMTDYPRTNIPRRSKRADTLPTPPKQSKQPMAEDLPVNPKLWTPSQVSAYLATALRVKSGESMALPTPVIEDIAFFIRDKRINGRSFLRLGESDLQQYGINKLWQDALLEASRNLRQNVLKGRIWGFGNGSLGDSSATPPSGSPTNREEEDDDDDTPSNRARNRARSDAEANRVYMNGHSSRGSTSSNSSLESFDESPTRAGSQLGRGRTGRVKNMAASFDRSGSFDEGDIAKPSSSYMRRLSIGSGSEDVFESATEGLPSDVDAGKLARPLPIPPAYSPLFVSPPTVESPLPPTDLDDPTMEELLASDKPGEGGFEESHNLTIMRRGSKIGAKAWEDDEDGIGLVTVKRLPTSSSDSGSFGKKVGDLFTDTAEEPAEEHVQALDAVVESALVHLDSEERRLQTEADDTRAMMLRLERRLSDLEHKISEMEEREALSEADRKEKETQPAQLTGSIAPGSMWRKLVFNIFGYTGSVPSSTELVPAPARRKRSTVSEIWDPKTISELPPYILLVGIGVVAVVLKVVLKRGPYPVR